MMIEGKRTKEPSLFMGEAKPPSQESPAAGKK
jgi:hypothetical protein